MVNIGRVAPQFALPAATYVPGRSAQDSHARWHDLAALLSPLPPLAPGRWQDCMPYLLGIDLFNHGYYWEAHEAWELLWHQCGRRGQLAGFLQGLIKLAAAGVKVLEQRPAGVVRHARRAAELFHATAAECGATARYLGLLPRELAFRAEAVALAPPAIPPTSTPAVAPVFPFQLAPQ